MISETDIKKRLEEQQDIIDNFGEVLDADRREDMGYMLGYRDALREVLGLDR